MTNPSADNEGIRLLDDFVCQAIPDVSLQKSAVPGVATRVTNEGVHVLPEAAPSSADGQGASDKANGRNPSDGRATAPPTPKAHP